MRILIVDDDTSVIQTLLATLKTLPGHDVRIATSGDKALENASGMGGVDLLITDVVMDPMDGFTLRDQLIMRYPNVRTILISGYDLSDYPEQTQYHQLLQKPFDPPTLVQAVQRELATITPTSPVSAKTGVLTRAPAGVPVRAAAGPGRAATAVGAPRAIPAGAPAVAVAQPRAAAAPAVQSRMIAPVAPQVAPAGAGESLIGQSIGAYQIVSYLGEGRLGSAYAAVQVSINRPVGLKVLDPGRAQDESVKARFIADARAKAHVQHPSILAVYEAGEYDGRIFYAREYVDGQSLAELATVGRALEEPTALKVIKVVAEGFIYLNSNNVPHRPLDGSKVFLGMDGQPRLANLAVQVAEEFRSPEQQIQALGQIMVRVVPGAQILSGGLNTLITRMIQASTSGMNAWGLVVQAVKALEPKIVPVEAAKITAQDRAAVEAVEAARRQQKRSFWWNIASLATLFAVVVFLAMKKFVFTNERKVQKMVKISAGTYKLPGGKTVQIERDFWIDKYEVTWGQYARFLNYLEKNPTADQDFRHPRMPRFLSHDNEDMRVYLGRAQAGKPARGIPIDLNCPAMDVTWWDAYAYARWLGTQTGTDRDLPTEEEWMVAAAGDKAYTYPWGNTYSDTIANTGADHKPTQPSQVGTKDGYNFWNPVDKLTGDQSPFGVYGLGGNVSEWTSTWTADNRFPIVKGGSYSKPAAAINTRIENQDPNNPYEWIGFRTISHSPPSDAE